MRLDELGAELEKRKDEFIETLIKECVPAAMPALLGEYKERIFTDGKATDGSGLGSYSKKAAYFTKKQFVRTGAFKPQGKTGEGKFTTGKKAGQSHQAMYLKGGYDELRQIQARQTAHKDQRYSGSLFNAVQIYEFEGRAVIGIAELKESLKRKGQEKQTGKVIYKIAAYEITVFEQALLEEIKVAKERIFG